MIKPFYYSDKLDKFFDTEQEANEAEAKLEKEESTELFKQDLSQIKETLKDYLEMLTQLEHALPGFAECDESRWSLLSFCEALTDELAQLKLSSQKEDEVHKRIKVTQVNDEEPKVESEGYTKDEEDEFLKTIWNYFK